MKEEDIHYGCLTCSTVQQIANLDMSICVGFGSAYVTRNGKIFYDGEKDCRNGVEPKTLHEIEETACMFPNEDWQLIMYSPLHGETYQRQEGKWIMIESNQGFA